MARVLPAASFKRKGAGKAPVAEAKNRKLLVRLNSRIKSFSLHARNRAKMTCVKAHSAAIEPKPYALNHPKDKDGKRSNFASWTSFQF